MAKFGAVPVACGDGVIERVYAVAPDGVDAVFNMAGGGSLRTVAELLKNPSQLISIADKALALELGGFELLRNRSTAVLTEIARLVLAGKLDPHVTNDRPLSDASALSPS